MKHQQGDADSNFLRFKKKETQLPPVKSTMAQLVFFNFVKFIWNSSFKTIDSLIKTVLKRKNAESRFNIKSKAVIYLGP